jgi:hypothetical protein
MKALTDKEERQIGSEMEIERDREMFFPASWLLWV